MESSLVNHILQSIHKASRFLYRDFFELEMQQSSKSSNKDFLQKSYTKCGERLAEELFKFGDQYTYNIKPIDSLLNFSRSLPYFGVTVIAFDKKNPEIPVAGVVDFPMLQESYYAEKGRGMWLKRHNSAMLEGSTRLAASKRNDELMLVCDKISDKLPKAKYTKIFDSDAYSLCLFVSGKADILYLSNPSEHILAISRFFVEEARGKINSQNPLILSNGCSNID